MNQSDIEAAIELLAGAVSYLCRLEELALERELRSAPEERREKVGALLNDRDVMRSLAEQLLNLRDRVAEYRRGGGSTAGLAAEPHHQADVVAAVVLGKPTHEVEQQDPGAAERLATGRDVVH